MIRNIVFDMGNVLIRFDPEAFMDKEQIFDPEDRKLVRRELFSSVEWAQMDLGVLTEDTAEPLVLSRIPERLKEKVRSLLHNWAYPRDEMPGMEELLQKLKDGGYRLFLLSNASVMQHDYWPQIPLSRFFEGKLISCDVKMVKPCPEIYRLFTKRFSLNPEECLFIDDATNNVAGAISCGWHGIVFHGDEAELEEKMKAAGVRLD